MALLHVGVYKEIYFSVFFGSYMLHRKKKKTVSHFDRKLKINRVKIYTSPVRNIRWRVISRKWNRIHLDSLGPTIALFMLSCHIWRNNFSSISGMLLVFHHWHWWKNPEFFLFCFGFFLHCLKDISFSIWNLFEQLLKCICMRKELCIPVFKKACFMENSSGQ